MPHDEPFSMHVTNCPAMFMHGKAMESPFLLLCDVMWIYDTKTMKTMISQARGVEVHHFQTPPRTKGVEDKIPSCLLAVHHGKMIILVLLCAFIVGVIIHLSVHYPKPSLHKLDIVHAAVAFHRGLPHQHVGFLATSSDWNLVLICLAARWARLGVEWDLMGYAVVIGAPASGEK
jgi:hypothetical protein